MLVFALSFISLVAVYFFYHSHGDNKYGPRYYYEAYGFLVLIASVGMMQVYAWLSKKWGIILARGSILLLAGLSVGLIIHHTRFHHDQIYQRRSLYRLVEWKSLQNDLVFVGSPSGDMTQGDLIRNLPNFMNADVIYAWDLGPKNRALIAQFPDRKSYLFRTNRESGFYELHPL